MAICIRDKRAETLAKELAARRGTNMTEAIIAALEYAIAADRDKQPLAARIAAISSALLAKTKPGGADLSRDQIDVMWGQ